MFDFLLALGSNARAKNLIRICAFLLTLLLAGLLIQPALATGSLLTLSILSLCLSAVLLAFVLLRRRPHRLTLEGLSLGYCLVFLAGFARCYGALMADTSSLFFCVCSALALLPVLYLTRTATACLCYTLCCVRFFYYFRLTDYRLLYPLLLALTLWYGLGEMRARPWGGRTQLYLWTVTPAALSYLLFHPDRLVFGIWFFCCFAALTALYLAASAQDPTRVAFYRSPLRCIATLGVFSLMIYGIFSTRWEVGGVASTTASINTLFFTLLVALCSIYIRMVLKATFTVTDFSIFSLFFLNFVFYLYCEFYRASWLGMMRSACAATAVLLVLILFLAQLHHASRCGVFCVGMMGLGGLVFWYCKEVTASTTTTLVALGAIVLLIVGRIGSDFIREGRVRR